MRPKRASAGAAGTDAKYDTVLVVVGVRGRAKSCFSVCARRLKSANAQRSVSTRRSLVVKLVAWLVRNIVDLAGHFSSQCVQFILTYKYE